jgi:hypothetical protein
MNDHDVFVSGEAPVDAVRAAIETALGATFRPSQEPEPVPSLAVGATMVFFHEDHPFEDDIGFAAARYRYWISVRDSARDEERQLAVARKVFDAVKAEGWPVMLSYGLQGNLATYPWDHARVGS